MIIDNIFAIKPYLGSLSLPLINPPTGLSSTATYTTFMTNISAIYSTQSNNGGIQVFYKTANSPDIRSTLTSLDPRQSYYFVSKTNASLPYSIPYSGALLNYTSPSTCTSLDIVPDRVVLTSTSGNFYYYGQNLSNLSIGEEYQYSFRVVESNWPIKIMPASGKLQSSQATNNFSALIRFDSDAGVTDYSSFLPAGTEIAQLDKKNLFAMVEVSVQPPNTIGCPKVVDILTIQCNSCLPLPTPTPTVTPSPTPTPAPLFSNTLTYVNQTVGLNGVNFGAATNGDTLEFTPLQTYTGTPATTSITVGASNVAIVGITSDYIGRSFRFTKASTGIRYVGTFLNGTASF
jgi:hypothetical protein